MTERLHHPAIDQYLEENDACVMPADVMRDIAKRIGLKLVETKDRKAWVFGEQTEDAK